MKFTSRLYQSENDLFEVGRLVRRAHTKRNYFNAWSFCRYDIWSQRRIADATSFHDDLWHRNLQLIHDENGTLLGAAFAFNNHHWRNDPEPYALILDPDYPQLAELLLDWAESQGMLEIEIIQGNSFLTGLIQSRGYTRSNDFMVMREKALADMPPETVHLAPGYSIRVVYHNELSASQRWVVERVGGREQALLRLQVYGTGSFVQLEEER